jgi:hypothetical protein
VQATAPSIDVGAALSLQESVAVWEDDRPSPGESPLPADKAEALQTLVLRAVQMAIGLRIAWPACTREGPVWETGAYALRIRAVELLAGIVVDVLTRAQEIVARTRTAHPEWVAPREAAELQANLPVAREILQKAQELSAWLSRKRPPVNEEMVRRSQESLSRGEGEDVGEIIARLQGGGALVKE